jgi:hypothetical protein
MNADFQTIAALVVVALVAIWFVVRAVRNRKSSGCGGGDCGAISPEMRRLQAKLKRQP